MPRAQKPLFCAPNDDPIKNEGCFLGCAGFFFGLSPGLAGVYGSGME